MMAPGAGNGWGLVLSAVEVLQLRLSLSIFLLKVSDSGILRPSYPGPTRWLVLGIQYEYLARTG